MVSHANFGRLKARTEIEQQIWNECARLISNCIIFYNATLLTELLSIKEKNKQYEDADLIKRLSLVAWQHVNLRGRYQFRNQKYGSNLAEIVDSLNGISIVDCFKNTDLPLN